MEYFVERLESDVAVCTDTDGKLCRIALKNLPDGVFEGCVLQQENDALILDTARTEARKAALLELQDSLFDEEAPVEESQ